MGKLPVKLFSLKSREMRNDSKLGETVPTIFMFETTLLRASSENHMFNNPAQFNKSYNSYIVILILAKLHTSMAIVSVIASSKKGNCLSSLVLKKALSVVTNLKKKKRNCLSSSILKKKKKGIVCRHQF